MGIFNNDEEVMQGQVGGGDMLNPSEETNSIGAQLTAHEAKQEVKSVEEVTVSTPLPFDMASLSPDQIRQLQTLLDSTPKNIITESRTPKITLRRIDGNFIMDFKNAFVGLVDDPENQRKVERHIIPVKYFGTDIFVNILYSSFINSERVPFDVIDKSEKDIEISEGKVFNREVGHDVVLLRKSKQITYTVKLPSGEKVAIDSKLANA